MSAFSRFAWMRNLLDYLRTSLWFVPLLLMLAALPLIAATLFLDASLAAHMDEKAFRLLYVGRPEDARTVLSTLLSSMIAMVSLVFSITMVVLTLAASQFGPRLVRNFMASPQTQIVLGAFVMTIVYCLLALAFVGWREGSGPLPYATVTGAIALVLGSVGLLILYLHGLARSIMSETVIERVSRELDGLMEKFRPWRPACGTAPHALPEDFQEKAGFFGLDKAGYVQAIDGLQLAEIAGKAGIVLRFDFRAGDFVVDGGRGIGACPRESLNDALVKRIRSAVLVGTHRTPVQDPTFPLRHMVEIAVRALSPGVNDPYTAAAALDWLSLSLSRLGRKELPDGVWRDRAGIVRVVVPGPTHDSLVAVAFDQIRQNGADKPIIAIHMLEAIGRVAAQSPAREQRAALRRQLHMMEHAIRRGITDPSDLGDVLARLAAARHALDQADGRECDRP